MPLTCAQPICYLLGLPSRGRLRFERLPFPRIRSVLISRGVTIECAETTTVASASFEEYARGEGKEEGG